MAAITARVLELLRMMHGGARLRVLPKGTAMLDVAHIAKGVRQATVEQMVSEGLITHDATTDRYDITDAGRDQVRVRDHVDDFIRSA